MNIKVGIVEDHRQIRESLSELIRHAPGYELTLCLHHALDVVNEVEQHPCDVILMDIQMPGVNGIEAVTLLRQRFPEIRLVIQTVFEDDDSIFKAICAGACGYILKKSSAQEYLQAIQEAFNGGAPITGSIASKVLQMFRQANQPAQSQEIQLSEREKEVLEYLVKGLSYKMIADKCHITYDTVRFHMKNIYTKLHVTSMTEAVAMALQKKIV